MVPLSVANVLLNNLLARSLFKVVPALCVLAGVYAFALTQFHDTPVMVIKTLGRLQCAAAGRVRVLHLGRAKQSKV